MSRKKTKLLLLSVVVPVYNEESSINPFYIRLRKALANTPVGLEIIFIDDGSIDQTALVLSQLHKKDKRVKILGLSRNFGKDIALSAGLDYANGDLIVPIDVDLQDPPELITTLIDKQKEGYDVVLAKRTHRDGESFLKLLSARLFYRSIGKITRLSIPENVGDFRLITKQVLETLKQLPERHRFMKGLFAWVGYKQTVVPYVRESRKTGTTKWNYWKLWNFAIDGVTSFSSLPLRIWTYIGGGVAFIAFAYALFLIIRTIIFGIDLPGYASLAVFMLFTCGIQLVTLGVIGEYIGRIFEETKQRPLYIVRESSGIKINKT